MDLARQILIKIGDDHFDELDLDDPAICYHLEMLCQKEFIEGLKVMRGVDGHFSYGLFGPRLTWDGNEFLDTIKSRSMWEKIKKLLQDKGVGMSVEAIKLAAPIALKAILGSN